MGPPPPATKAGVEQSFPPHQGHTCCQEDPHPCQSILCPPGSNYLCLRRKNSPSPECPTYALCFSPSLGHLADGRSPAGPYLLLLDPQALSLGSGETGGRHLSRQHSLTPTLIRHVGQRWGLCEWFSLTCPSLSQTLTTPCTGRAIPLGQRPARGLS